MAEDRAVSDVIGFVLVFGLVASTVAIVSVSGLNSLEHARDAEQANNAERAFDVLADNVEDVYREGAPSRSTEISLVNAQLNTGTTIYVNVSGRDTASSNVVNLFGRDVRPIVWDGPDETQFVYALGGVLRADREGGLVVDDPPFMFGSDRTVVPLLDTEVEQGQSFGEATILVRTEHGRAGSSRPDADALAVQEPPTYDELLLNITSPRAEIWNRHLDEKPGVDCSVTQRAGVDSPTTECVVQTRDELYVTRVPIDVELEG